MGGGDIASEEAYAAVPSRLKIHKRHKKRGRTTHELEKTRAGSFHDEHYVHLAVISSNI